MSKHASPTLIGTFVLGAFTLGVVAILLLAGDQWFREHQQQILYFEGAAQGLQVGAPVVLLGVKVGTVKRIQLGLEEDSRKFLVPVTIEIAPSVVMTRSGEQIDLRDTKTLQQMVERGLRAQLRMQSLLTGLLYIDLDFYPGKPARYFAIDPTLNEIPTIRTTVDELSLKLEAFPMEKFLDDLAAVSGSLRKLLDADETAELPQRLNRTLLHLESLASKFDVGSDTLLPDLQRDLTALNRTLTALTGAADLVAALAAPESAPVANLTRAGHELAEAARAVRILSEENSPAIARLEMALQEISRAARALRLLAETLEQQPEALLRGKPGPEEKHAP